MKALGRLFKFVGKMISWAVFIAFAIPVAYFAVRMGQPMDLPEYKGLTYYQYIEWEKSEQHKNWEKIGEAYRAKNPDSGLSEKACNRTSFGIGHVALFLTQGPTILLDQDSSFDYALFLPNWWASFEEQHLALLRGNPKGYPPCRIPGSISDDYALAVGVQLPEMVQE